MWLRFLRLYLGEYEYVYEFFGCILVNTNMVMIFGVTRCVLANTNMVMILEAVSW